MYNVFVFHWIRSVCGEAIIHRRFWSRVDLDQREVHRCISRKHTFTHPQGKHCYIVPPVRSETHKQHTITERACCRSEHWRQYSVSLTDEEMNKNIDILYGLMKIQGWHPGASFTHFSNINPFPASKDHPLPPPSAVFNYSRPVYIYHTWDVTERLNEPCGGELSKYCFNYVVDENRAWSRGRRWQAAAPPPSLRFSPCLSVSLPPSTSLSHSVLHTLCKCAVSLVLENTA